MSGSFSQVGQGAAGGAMAGAAFGPWGAAIGGVAGGALAYFGNDGEGDYQDQLKKLANSYQGRQGPLAGPANTAQYSGFRQNQAALISQLEAMSRGEGPSAAAVQMRDAMDRAAGAQASGAAGAGGRGVNAGAAMRQSMNNTAAVQSQGARDTATLRSQEQMNATQMLGQNIQAGRGADEGVNEFNATAQNQQDLANLSAKMQMMGLNDQSQLQALMLAMKSAGPGTGTQVLAGGAMMSPLAVQWMKAQQGGKGAASSPGQARQNGMYGGDSSDDDMYSGSGHPGPVSPDGIAY